MSDSEDHINAKEYGLCAEKAKKVSHNCANDQSISIFHLLMQIFLFQDVISGKGRTHDYVLGKTETMPLLFTRRTIRP